MTFQSGRVSFVQFGVSGDAPGTVDETCLSILKAGAFKEQNIGVPDALELGFTTGEHLFDVQFTFEKNGYGPAGSWLLFAMRMDTHEPPSEVKQAYRKINEQAASEQSPTGFASKREKRDARESADRQLNEDLAAGKFRRSRTVPLLWDMVGERLFCGSSSIKAIDAVARLMRDHFAVELRYLSAGTMAGETMRRLGRDRDYEDVRPSGYTDPPAEFTLADEDDGDAGSFSGGGDRTMPRVPWVTKSVDLKDFLGNEFLIWLWWLGETAEGRVEIEADRKLKVSKAEVYVVIDQALDMECAWETLGKQTLRGNGPTRLAEAGDALKTGKWPRKMGLIVSDGEWQWQLTLQGDRMAVSSAALPEVEDAQHPRELLDGRLERAMRLAQLLEGLYVTFLKQRIGGSYDSKRQTIRKWIASRV